MTEIITQINRIVWGIPTLLMIISTGIVLTIRTRFAQFRLFPRALRDFCMRIKMRNNDSGGVSSYRALCTALAATVGTGNLAGVAGAICLGGPGAVFWMWVCALLGMVIKFAEAMLAIRYRQKNTAGEYVGGTMYIIKNGLGKKWLWLGSVYCFFGVIAAFGVGNATQINTVIGGVDSVLTALGTEMSNTTRLIIAISLSVIIITVLLGGAKRIGSLAEKLVPFASVVYILMCIGVIVLRFDAVPFAIRSIIIGAFSPRAVTGGIIGTVMISARVGASRGIFTNEAGMGTAAIAHASASVKHPIDQGLMGIIEVFLDTIVICTMTAVVILTSGVQIPFGVDEGVLLTSRAFSSVCGNWVTIPLSLAIACFAFATVFGWGLYGARCAQFLFGDGVWKWFVILQGITVVVGAMLKTEIIWTLSEIVNGLMAVPNLIALLCLSKRMGDMEL